MTQPASKTAPTTESAQPFTLAHADQLASDKLEYSEKIYDALAATAPMLAGCYYNWMRSESHTAFGAAEKQVWERAADLYAEYLPIVLKELAAKIGEHIRQENPPESEAANSVANELQDINPFLLFEHIN